MAFEQAAIELQNKGAFDTLRSLIERALTESVDGFMSEVKRVDLRIRSFEEVLRNSLLEKANGAAGGEALGLYQSLPMSDQAQMREFYLTRVERVDDSIRQKYSKLYRYS